MATFRCTDKALDLYERALLVQARRVERLSAYQMNRPETARRFGVGGVPPRAAAPTGVTAAVRNLVRVEWLHATQIRTQEWRCGFCDREVASNEGWVGVVREGGHQRVVASVAVCPRCELPSVLSDEAVIPAPRFGEPIEHLPDDVDALYTEARAAVARSRNSAALACRKILMHVAVEKKAPEGESFASYVTYLEDNGLVPSDARDWVDEIRELGNDANHEIDLITEDEAKVVVDFTAMLLRVVYDYPERGRKAKAARQARRP